MSGQNPKSAPSPGCVPKYTNGGQESSSKNRNSSSVSCACSSSTIASGSRYMRAVETALVAMSPHRASASLANASNKSSVLSVPVLIEPS